MDIKIFSVSQITFAIKSLIEPTFRSISVKGEISNFKKHSSGHFYFNLKDDKAQIFCAFFKNDNKNISRLPKDGDQITIKGSIAIYPPRGNYQIIVKELIFSGIGELLIKLHQLKEKLKIKGYFEREKKQSLPKYPKRIGIITSPTGAVIQDILNVLSRRNSSFHLLLNPVNVQGEKSEKEIAQAIDDFNKYDLADVLIIGRGGGSLEDLWAFNEEIVADAIYRSKIPIISAVGHETDFSISDFVADVRAPTPSAAAEIAIQEKTKILKDFDNYHTILKKTLLQYINNCKIQINSLVKQPLFSSTYALLGKDMQRLDDIKENLDISIKTY